MKIEGAAEAVRSMLRLRVGSMLVGRCDFEALVVFISLLAFSIGLDHCLVHRYKSIPRPHMLSPVLLSRLRKFCPQKPTASRRLDLLRQLR
jgi:hypothetical protein